MSDINILYNIQLDSLLASTAHPIRGRKSQNSIRKPLSIHSILISVHRSFVMKKSRRKNRRCCTMERRRKRQEKNQQSVSSSLAAPSPVPIFGFVTSCPQDFSGQGNAVNMPITPRMPTPVRNNRPPINSKGQINKKYQQNKLGWGCVRTSPNAES